MKSRSISTYALLALFVLIVGYLVLGREKQSGVIEVEGAFARAASPSAKAGAAFFTIANGTGTDDRLIAASSPAARMVELHTHKMNADGVAMMMPVEGGITVPAGGEAALKRGGDHVMLMGLVKGLSQGDNVELTLTFENAGDITLTVPVDLNK